MAHSTRFWLEYELRVRRPLSRAFPRSPGRSRPGWADGTSAHGICVLPRMRGRAGVGTRPYVVCAGITSVELGALMPSASIRAGSCLASRHVAPDALVRGGRTERPLMEVAFRRAGGAGRVRAPAPTWPVLALRCGIWVPSSLRHDQGRLLSCLDT